MELNSVASGTEDRLKENKEEDNVPAAIEEEDSKKEEEAKKTWGEKMQDAKIFIWNPETHQFMGRTGRSWGVMIKPYMSGFRFVFNASESSSWSSYVQSMHSFLEAYDDSLQSTKNIECDPGKYFRQRGPDAEQKKACQFTRSMLQNCSGLEDPTFGYSVGQPCLFLKMNRIVGYEAGFGTPIYVTCEVVKGEAGDLTSVHFYPENGTFDLMYYPYYGKLTHVNYTSPLVAVHFTDVRKNHPVNVECKLNGKDIINNSNNDRFLGRIIFTLEIGV